MGRKTARYRRHGSPIDLLFGSAESVDFRLAWATPLSHRIIILRYETDKIISEAK